MADSEKVLKGLLECLKGEGSTECSKCPYLTEKCTVSLREEATELKKEYDELSEEFNSAVELIRKKNEQIKILKTDVEALKNAYKELAEKGEVVVRCKDCKHRPKEPDYKTYESGFDLEFPEESKCPCLCCGDKWYSWYPDDEWFCAEGERK